MTWEVSADHERFDSAVAWFTQRVPITDTEFLARAEQARRQAFWMAGVTQAEVINQVHRSLAKNIADGVPFEEWKKAIGPTLSKAWIEAPHEGRAARTETVHRNWIQASYNRARWEQMREPAVRKHRPYLMFDGIADQRQSPICKACHGTVLPADDPWWEAHRPPLHHRCRSGLRSLTTSRALQKGINATPPKVDAQEGFGTTDEWKGPDRSKLPKGGVKPPAKPKAGKVPKAPKPAPFKLDRDFAKLPRTPVRSIVQAPSSTTSLDELELLRREMRVDLSELDAADRLAVKRFSNGHDTEIRQHQLGKTRDELIAGRRKHVREYAIASRKLGYAGDVESAADTAKHVDESIASALQLRLMFQRAKPDSLFEHLSRGMAMTPGAVESIVQDGVLNLRGQDSSFSWSGAVANRFAASQFDDGKNVGKVFVVLRVKHASGVTIETLSDFSHEHEVLMPGSVRFKVTKVSAMDFDDAPRSVEVGGGPVHIDHPPEGVRAVLIEAEEIN
ncbi:MAG: minor capsid protein [Methylibium sp.]|nr:minor capsid protein [Methylibium sp.]